MYRSASHMFSRTMRTMQYLMIAVMMCVVISDCSASICCFPPTYQGHQEIIKATLKDGRMSVMTGTIQYWHDNVSRRSAFVEKLVIDGTPTELKLIKDYNMTNTQYTIIGSSCRRKSIHGNYPYGCVPDSATNEETRLLGRVGGQNSMNIRTFDQNKYPDDVSRLTVDATDCYLLSDITVYPHAAQPYMQYVLFSNFTEGIDDYSVFDVPSSCDPGLVG